MPETEPTTQRFALADVHLFHRNPRQGSVPHIEASLRAHGQYKPITINRGTHTGRPFEVLAGNHTLKALRNLQEAEPEDPRWRQVVGYLIDVDDDEATRIVLVDNRTGELGGMDVQELHALLTELPDLTGTAYSEADLAQLTAGIEQSGVDAMKEWEGMPHYEQNERENFRSLTVHFENQEAVDAFCAALNVELSAKGKTLYLPPRERETLTGEHYVSAE